MAACLPRERVSPRLTRSHTRRDVSATLELGHTLPSELAACNALPSSASPAAWKAECRRNASFQWAVASLPVLRTLLRSQASDMGWAIVESSVVREDEGLAGRVMLGGSLRAPHGGPR